jgi:glycolate oxidase iron-sulfur subunit
MQTRLTAEFAQTQQGRDAQAILRSCVHCGFCTATCPTYQLLGDERDGPRGRIYLIKQVLEGDKPTRETQLRLDRCLTCRACETSCPSGVQYGRLLDIGREQIEKQVNRPWSQRLLRSLLLKTVPYRGRIGPLIKAGQIFKPLLPSSIRQKVPAQRQVQSWPRRSHRRLMLVSEGCIQSVISPATNQALAEVLDKLSIELVSAEQAGCCGAMSQHLSAPNQAREMMKANIDAWWPHIARDIEAIIVSASGCGAMVKDYGYLLRDDPVYAAKAAKVSALAKDPVEIIRDELKPQQWSQLGQSELIAFQSPCTLQHGQQLTGEVENLLQQCGFRLTVIRDSHLCCGSAGTYSLLQPELSKQLQQNKLQDLYQDHPSRIVTANIGCQLHLSTQQQPLVHWIELVAEKLRNV